MNSPIFQKRHRASVWAGWFGLASWFCLALGAAVAKDDSPRSLNVAGYVEQVQIAGTDIKLDGRLDTGAGLSSLNALDLELFEHEGNDWVHFEIVDPNDDEERIALAYPLERKVRILRHSGNHQERYVVKLGLCVAGHYRVEEVSLADRSELTYQLLVGRNHMEHALLVDPGERHLHEPDCPAEANEVPEGGRLTAEIEDSIKQAHNEENDAEEHEAADEHLENDEGDTEDE